MQPPTPLTPEQPENGDIELAVEQVAALAGPILNQLFQAAATNQDLWLKKKSVKHLATWIQSTQDITDILHQALEQASEVIGAQEAELEKLRPEKGKMWMPGLG